ncbi:B3 domain-containing protein REM19-like [Humulus lupulus]|uniref:B3 domain-containing protein REM19-like n=1 Tax=Humulus lupulus TaxID=3486 RepID=UPI002B40EAF1|nr:B3 domain-containing protein REM19-like [Humulus lupulus]
MESRRTKERQFQEDSKKTKRFKASIKSRLGYKRVGQNFTVEIDYPATLVHFGMPNIDVKLRVPKREVIDDSIEILDEIGVKSSCSQPSKRMKTYPPGKLDSPSKSTDKSDTNTAKKMNNGIPKTKKTLDKSERIAALQRTVGFKSEHPYFKMVMQPYYILGKNMTFPPLFAKTHLNNRSYDVTLKVPNDNKTWPVKYTYKNVLREDLMDN